VVDHGAVPSLLLQLTQWTSHSPVLGHGHRADLLRHVRDLNHGRDHDRSPLVHVMEGMAREVDGASQGALAEAEARAEKQVTGDTVSGLTAGA